MHDLSKRESLYVVRRRALLLAVAATCASGCFGEFAATRALYRWNVEASDSKWLRWLVFLALAILPVYELFILADALVVNTIEFFSGKNPIGHSQVNLDPGRSVKSERTKDPNLIRHEYRNHGEVERVLYVRRIAERELLVLDEHFRVLSRVELTAAGEAVLHDAAGRKLSAMSAQQVDRAARALELGRSVSETVHGEIEQDLARA